MANQMAMAAVDAENNPQSVRTRRLAVIVALAFTVLLGLSAVKACQRYLLGSQLLEARELLRQFEPQAAIDLLTSVVAEHPDCAEAEYLLGTAYRRAGRLDLVESHLRRADELNWNKDEIDRQFCLTFFQAGDFRRATTDVMERLQQRVDDDEAEEVYEALARGYMAAMLLKQANFVLDGWLRWRPQRARAHLLRADVAALGGSEQGEIECYREAVRCDPTDFEAQRALARVLLSSNNEVATAETLFRSCLQQRPHDPDVLLGLAECQERRGQVAEAKELLARVLAAQPGDRQRAAALALEGQMALAAKDYDEASRLFQQAVDAYPSNVPIVYSLAQALSRANRGEEAQEYLERWRRLKALDQTLDNLHAELLRHPDDPDVRAQIGEALLEQGSTKAGLNWLLSVLLYNRSHAVANLRLAEYYDHEGQPELAARHRAMAQTETASHPATLSPLITVPKTSDAMAESDNAK